MCRVSLHVKYDFKILERAADRKLPKFGRFNQGAEVRIRSSVFKRPFLRCYRCGVTRDGSNRSIAY